MSLVAVLLVASTALAGGMKLTDADLATMAKLLDAKAMSRVVVKFAPDAKARDEAKLGFDKALADVGWTMERYSTVSAEVEEILGLVQNIESDKQYEADYRRQLAQEHDADTVARVKAHSHDLDSSEASERAERRWRDERALAATGRPVTPKDIQGTWVFDLDASLAHISSTMGIPAEEAMRTALEKNQGTSYSFTGNAIEVKGIQNQKGAYRIDGKDLVIIDGKREYRVQIGLKNPDQLVFSMMGVGTVYTRKK